MTIAKKRSSIEGHFRGRSAVSDVVILRHVMDVFERQEATSSVAAIPVAKFLAKLSPDEDFKIRLYASETNTVSFECVSGERIVTKECLDYESDS